MAAAVLVVMRGQTVAEVVEAVVHLPGPVSLLTHYQPH